MAEFTYNPIQTVEPNQAVILNTSIGCNKGYVIHRDGSGLVTLRGIVNNPYAPFARYQVTFNANIALSEGATVGPIAVALTIDGEALQTSRAIVTPAAVGDYFNVTSTAFITVPRGCCTQVSAENVSISATPGTTPAPEIDVQNANMVITRVA